MEELKRRIDHLELRVDRTERACEENALAHAVSREAVRIYTDLVNSFDNKLDELTRMLHSHIHQEAKDRTKLFAGIVTSAMTGIGSLGVLIWGVFEILHRAP